MAFQSRRAALKSIVTGAAATETAGVLSAFRSLTDNQACIARYHTAGVPGRHEIDETQELNYPAILRASKATGFAGYVAQEFSPKQPDKIASLRKAVLLCDV